MNERTILRIDITDPNEPKLLGLETAPAIPERPAWILRPGDIWRNAVGEHREILQVDMEYGLSTVTYRRPGNLHDLYRVNVEAFVDTHTFVSSPA